MGALPSRYRNIIIVGLAAIFAAGAVTFVLDRREGPTPLEISFTEPTPGEGGPIQVYITGAVAEPGVYEMSDGDRVIDLLGEAGGQASDANLEAINLSLRLHDEDQVVVPRQGEPAVEVSNASSQVLAAEGRPVNINAASARELDEALPGIGEVYSQRIVDSRTWDGMFTSPEDLVERRLIPDATFEKIEHLISVGP